MRRPFVCPGVGLLGDDRFVPTRDGRWLRTMVAGPAAGASGVSEASSASGAGGTWGGLADLVDVVRAFPHRRLVLVGHSWGGPIVRRAAQILLDDAHAAARSGSAGSGERGDDASRDDRGVTGVVLVDPTDENADLYFHRSTAVTMRLNRFLLVGMARFGLLRPLLHRMGEGLPTAVRDAAAQAGATAEAAAASAAELSGFLSDVRDLREAGWQPQHVPVRLVSGVRPGPREGATRDALIAAHRTTARDNLRVELVEATASSHLVPLTEPEVVVGQVRDLLGAARREEDPREH
ncbi:alpha/beta fold hydrolase [Brevibacterium yomogidense]|uniref:alpha/beta fold hydrolase n=1 Tax=Brevibacterium yomogidense TaxID=946573 RepID=UPI0018DF0900